jgi:hypothetical protein
MPAIPSQMLRPASSMRSWDEDNRLSSLIGREFIGRTIRGAADMADEARAAETMNILGSPATE